MRILKIIVIALVVYVAVVATFESLLGFFQPTADSTLVITTFDDDGPHERVVSRIDAEGRLYVAANHWPRAWYRRALENPEVEIALDGEKSSRLAVPVGDEEHERVNGEEGLPLAFRILTGFPPRYFLRLDPRST